MTRPNSTGLSSLQVHVVGAAAVGAITVASWLVAIQPVARERAALHDLRDEIDATRARVDTAANSRRRLQAELTTLRSRIDTSSVQLLPSDRLNHRLARLIDLANESALVVHFTQSGDPLAGPRFDTVHVTLSGTGQYPECAAFLHELHTELTDVAVTGLELNGNPIAPADSTFRFDLAWYAAPSQLAAQPTESSP